MNYFVFTVYIVSHKIYFCNQFLKRRCILPLDNRVFFSMLGDRLMDLGLSEYKVREEISALRYKFRDDPRFGTFVTNASEDDVRQFAERVYAKIIVRSNTPAGVDSGKYTGIIAQPEAEEKKSSGGKERHYNEKTDYVGAICHKLKRSFDRNPASKLLLILLIPLTAILLLTCFAVFGALFAAIVLMAVGFFALTCLVALGGTVITLVGLIYGVVKIFTGAPAIGWYEIGIAVTALGMTVFAGVTFYNCAVRFAPVGIRQVWSLLKVFFFKVSNQVKTAKGVFSEK